MGLVKYRRIKTGCEFKLNSYLKGVHLERIRLGDDVVIVYKISAEIEEAIRGVTWADFSFVIASHDCEFFVHIPFSVVSRSHYVLNKGVDLDYGSLSVTLQAKTWQWEDLWQWIEYGTTPDWAET